MTWLPLNGPNEKGLAPKGCSVRGWNEPAYKGVDVVGGDRWVGLRLDDYVVIDCDCVEAKDAWLAHIEMPLEHTFVRMTPHGFHFFYKRPALRVESRKLPTIHPLMEVKTGVGHQVVYFAPGYDTINAKESITFDPAWLPPVVQGDKGIEEWDEMPDGIGDNAMISFAGKFREWGMSEETMRRCLESINQRTMTRDPMPQKSIRRIARQAAKYETGDHELEKVQCVECGAEMEVR